MRTGASAGVGAAVYPKPLRPGFRNVRCSGFEGGVPGEGPAPEQFQLEIETMNGTAWSSAVRRLERTTAHIVLVQETTLTAKDVPRISVQAKRRGWQTVWVAAGVGKRGMPSGGVVICARAPVELSDPPRGPKEVVAGKVVAAMAEAPGCRPMLIYCGYLKDGVGANEENLGILARIGAHRGLQPEGMQIMVGADFNLPPHVGSWWGSRLPCGREGDVQDGEVGQRP